MIRNFLIANYLILFAATLSHRPSPLQLAGLLLAYTCLPLVAVARWQLGPAFQLHAVAISLVTTGLYRYLRNPIYLFSTILYFGEFLAAFSSPVWSIVWLVVIIPIQWNRASKEALVLEARFGPIYRYYRSQTWL